MYFANLKKKSLNILLKYVKNVLEKNIESYWIFRLLKTWLKN